MKKKGNIPLIIGLALPVVMILIVLTVVYLPSLFVDPEYDFVYVSSDSYRLYYNYQVDSEGRLSRRTGVSSYDTSSSTDQMYLYDVSAEESERIDFERAIRFEYSTKSKSPDGYEFERNSGGGGFIFPISYYGSSRNYVLKKGNSAKEISLETDRYQNVEFVGWVLDK